MSTTKQHIIRERLAHHAALETLRAAGCTTSGIDLWRKLCRIERQAHNATTAQCNGAAYGSQPFREEEAWEEFVGEIKRKVAAVFGHSGTLPGFFVNGDARGMALKLDPERCTIPHGMCSDMGGYGILAAEINN